MNLLYIDLFCGAGGVTTGISQVPGAVEVHDRQMAFEFRKEAS